jgi:hypothetical protein
VPRKHRHFRFSEAADQALATYSQKWNCTPTEALEKLLLRWRYLDDVGFTEFQETLTDEMFCSLRVRVKGLFYCLHGVPRNVKLDRRLIETLDICRVCRTRNLGLTDKSLARSDPVNMVMARKVSKSPFSSDSGSDRTRSRDPFDKPSTHPPPPAFHCTQGHNRSFCYNNPCDQRANCKTPVER